MQIRRTALAVAAVAAIALAGVSGAREPGSAAASERAPIVFVCQNGVAMSVWSARTFDRLAAERGLALRAISRAAAPTYTRVPLRMRLALWLDGFRVGDYRPQVISAADVRGAERVILIDAALPPAAFSAQATIETWAGFPPMREQYFASRAALKERVEALVARLATTRGES